MKLRFAGPLFRHVSKEDYARQFVSGEYIQISTFQRCRDYEDAEQGDSGEGHTFYTHSPITSGDADFEIISERLGIKNTDPRVNFVMANSCKTIVVPNAYVLCLSYKIFARPLTDKFGIYCVAINDICDFFYKLVAAIKLIVPVKTASAGPVKYAAREYRDLEEEPGPIAYLKPVHPYGDQREFRVVIICEDGHDYQPFGVRVPGLQGLCRYVKLNV